MAVNTTTASLRRGSQRGTLVIRAGGRAIARFLESVRGVWDGSSWEPGRHSLTRVDPPGVPQSPR
jgi:hypothetical protein